LIRVAEVNLSAKLPFEYDDAQLNDQRHNSNALKNYDDHCYALGRVLKGEKQGIGGNANWIVNTPFSIV
jgi:hypothetical protein